MGDVTPTEPAASVTLGDITVRANASTAIVAKITTSQNTAKVGAATPEKIPVTACEAGNEYLVKWDDSKPPSAMKFAGAHRGVYSFVDSAGARVKLEATDNVWEAPRTSVSLTEADVLKFAELTCPKCSAPLTPENTSSMPGRGIYHVGCPAVAEARATQPTTAIADGLPALDDLPPLDLPSIDDLDLPPL